MAIDTRNKRFSIMTLGRTIQPVMLTPDGTIDQADRQSLLWGYSGILWEGLSVIVGRMCVTITAKSPSVSITGKSSSVEITGKTALVTITGEGC